VDIELRQHQDGRFFLDVRVGSSRTEVEVTSVIHEIFLGKLRELQNRVRAEEKYSDFVVEKAKGTSSILTSVYARYKGIVGRLQQTNTLLIELVEAWKTSKSITRPMMDLEVMMKQNDHFLMNDTTLEELERSVRGE